MHVCELLGTTLQTQSAFGANLSKTTASLDSAL